MQTQLTEHWKTSPLASDIINYSRAVLANAAHQALVLELRSHYGLSLAHISDQANVDLERLASLAAGTLGSLTLCEYDRLLCFYYFNQARSPSNHWRDLAGTSLSIHAKEQRVRRASKRKTKRYYICDNENVYLTQREYDVALSLFKNDFSYKSIGKKLNLSPRTVEFYVANLRVKFNVPSRMVLKQHLKPLLSELNKTKERNNESCR